MPSIVKITSHRFRNEETLETIDYKRLSIIGVLNGETRTLSIKLSKTELMLAELLLASTGTPDENASISAGIPHERTDLGSEADSLIKQSEQQASIDDFKKDFDGSTHAHNGLNI